MILITMKQEASVKETSAVIKFLENHGLTPHLTKSNSSMLIGIVQDTGTLLIEELRKLAGVEKVEAVKKAFKLASREFRREKTIVIVRGIRIGGKEITVMAGPCAVESRDQLLDTACRVRDSGAKVLRGGAFKPRSSPYSFQGLGEKGLELLAEAREKTGLAIVTEILSPEHLEIVSGVADILQVGARNMQNFALLDTLGKIRKPILLKRGMMSTMEELLMSAEYLLASGNDQVILCERGIRTFEKYTRNTLDLAAIPIISRLSHLPIIVDPSHAAGDREIVPSLSAAAIAAGADGLIVEVHIDPDSALCDGLQSLRVEQFDALMTRIQAIAVAMGREI
ncbi:MAG: 3-deoxy-7-phosphoheptulonate synthase [Candidatus Glassbacteria bacterium]